jgi:hypothetical protein
MIMTLSLAFYIEERERRKIARRIQRRVKRYARLKRSSTT